MTPILISPSLSHSIHDTPPNSGERMGAETISQQRFEGIRNRLRKLTGKAIRDFSMIEDRDKVMVCLSGGADSHTLLDVLLYLQGVAPIHFDIVAVNLDQKQPGFPTEVLPEYFKSIGVAYKIIEQDTYSVVREKIPAGKTTCSLCSRLRRGALYKCAKDIGATKIALGHHRGDILETFLLNMFYGGTLKTMPPKLLSDDKENVVIRPLAYCKEDDIKRYAAAKNFPIIPCDLCGSQPNLQRQAMKNLLKEWDREHPGRIRSIFGAIGNVVPSHLMDHSLHDFSSACDKTAPAPKVGKIQSANSKSAEELYGQLITPAG